MALTVSAVPLRGRERRSAPSKRLGVEGLGGAPGGVGLLVDDLVEAVGDEALDLVLGEGGGAQGVGEQGEAALQTGGGDLQGDADAGVVGVGVEGGAGAFEFGGVLLGGEGVGAFAEGAGEDGGDAVEAVGFGGERGVEEDLDGDELLAGPVAVQDGDAVAEGGALGGGEGPGAGGAGLGLGVERHGGDVVGAHAAAPSSSVAAGASVSSAVVGS